jgi:hypothetical protein
VSTCARVILIELSLVVIVIGLVFGKRAMAWAWHRIRFRFGQVKAEVAPLNQDEARVLLEIVRGYEGEAREPDRRAREDQ